LPWTKTLITTSMLAISQHLMAEHGFVEKEPDVWNSTGQALTQQWAPTTYYNEGDTVCLGNNCWIVIVPGLSGGTAPTSTSGTETNGDITFQSYDTNSPSFIEQQIQLEADNNNDNDDDEKEDDSLVIEKIDQDALTLAGQQWTGNDMTLNVTGGSGDGEITSYISTYEENCTVSTTGVVTRINDDADALCTITVTKAGDETYNPISSSWLIDMTSDLTPQAAFDINPFDANNVNNGQYSLENAAFGGSGSGAVTYSVPEGQSVCSVVNNMLVWNTSGSCDVTATKASADFYQAATNMATYTYNPISTPLAITNPTESSWDNGDTISLEDYVSGGNGGEISYVSATPSVCSVSGNSLTRLTSGSCQVEVTEAASGVFLAQNGQMSFSTSTTASPLSVATISESDFGSGNSFDARTKVTGGSGDGSLSFTSDTPSICNFDADGYTIRRLTEGVCEFTVTKVADGFFDESVQTANFETGTIACTISDMPVLARWDDTNDAKDGIYVAVALSHTNAGQSCGSSCATANNAVRSEANQVCNALNDYVPACLEANYSLIETYRVDNEENAGENFATSSTFSNNSWFITSDNAFKKGSGSIDGESDVSPVNTILDDLGQSIIPANVAMCICLDDNGQVDNSGCNVY
jgi:hypothetical protein